MVLTERHHDLSLLNTDRSKLFNTLLILNDITPYSHKDNKDKNHT